MPFAILRNNTIVGLTPDTPELHQSYAEISDEMFLMLALNHTKWAEYAGDPITHQLTTVTKLEADSTSSDWPIVYQLPTDSHICAEISGSRIKFVPDAVLRRTLGKTISIKVHIVDKNKPWFGLYTLDEVEWGKEYQLVCDHAPHRLMNLGIRSRMSSTVKFVVMNKE